MKHPVIHFEIMGKDSGQLGTFYGEVFGWNVGPPMPDHLAYRMIDPVPGIQRGIMGGVGNAPNGYDGHVTFYVHVDDIERTFKEVESRGGSRMLGPEKVPGGPTIGLFRDPEGHTIGVVDVGDDMRGAPMELAPFVFFYGRCEEALEFYKNALDGSFEIVQRDGEMVQYAKFSAMGFSFKASDGMSKRAIDPDEGNVTLSLTVLDPGRAEEIFNALADGGKALHAFGDAEWGGKFGALQDRFGNEWFVATQ